MLVAPLRWVHHPSFRALILRRTFPDLERSLIDRSRGLYRSAFPGATYNDSKHVWRFPSGATIAFGHCAHESDVYQYQGAEFAFIGFDELTHFTRLQYTYMLSRARSSKGLPIRVRASTNPGGTGHDWVFERWGAWLDPKSTRRTEPGAMLHYRNAEEGERWCDAAEPGALSRVFIPAKLTDNPHLTAADPQYLERLMGLDAVTRSQLLDGNWLARAAKGLLFKRAWFETVDAAPRDATRIRYWDRAATIDGDWTAGVKLARASDGTCYVEHVKRFRGRPREVMATIKQTAIDDGEECLVGIEQDPGQAGVFEAQEYVTQLEGQSVHLFKPTGSKLVRAQPASAWAENGRVKIVRGDWNKTFIEELEDFPEGNNDDQVDGFSGAFAHVPRDVDY